MYVSRKMHGTFAVQGIPPRGTGTAKKLSFKADSDYCLLPVHSHDRLGRIPSGATGCTAKHLQGTNMTFFIHLRFKFRGPEKLSIVAQADLPGQAASCGGRYGLGDFQFLA